MEADPSIVLEWLDVRDDGLRELQLNALEQFCKEILFSDNIDVFHERYSPQLFIPALCKIFLDELAPDSVLEANARALTYYLDLGFDCVSRVARSTQVLSAITSRLDAIDMTSAQSNELGQQLIKMLQLICAQDPGPIYNIGGLTSVLRFIRLYPNLLHADVLQAGMDIIRRLFTKVNPSDPNLSSWIESLSSLLDRREAGVADQTLRAFANLVSRFTRTGADPSPLADPHIIDRLLLRLRIAGGVEMETDLPESGVISSNQLESGVLSSRDGASVECNPAAVHAVTNILTTLCCSSVSLTRKLLTEDKQFAPTLAMIVQRSTDEVVVISVLRLIEIVLILIYQTSENSSSASADTQSPQKHSKSLESSTSDKREEPAAYIVSPSKSEKSHAGESSRSDVHIPSSGLASSSQVTKTVESPETTSSTAPTTSDNMQSGTSGDASAESRHNHNRDALHRRIIEAIKRNDLDFLKANLKSKDVDVNYTDHLGQTLLNWAASFGSPAIVELLCAHGANVNLGVRSSLDYAATFGRVEVCRTLIAWGADVNKRDSQGRRPIDSAREHTHLPGSQQVIELLEIEGRRVGLQSSRHPDSTTSGGVNTSSAQTIMTDPSEAQRILIHQVLPLLVNLFNESTSSSVRNQCTFLVWRMIDYIQPNHLEEISLLEIETVPFAFYLGQLVYTVLIEEREELILRAFEMSHCLLRKLPRIYVPVFHRLGLIPLIRESAKMLTYILHQVSTPIKPPEESDTNTGVATTTATTVTTMIPPTIEQGDSKPSPTIVSAQNTATTTTQLTSPGGTTNPTKDTSEVTAKPSASLPVTLSEAANQTETTGSTSTSKNINVGRCISAHLYWWNEWYLIYMGQLLSIFSRRAFVTIQLQPDDGGLRALCIHSGGDNRQIPVQLHPGEDPIERPALKSRMLRMHRHLMELANNESATTPLTLNEPEEPSPALDEVTNNENQFGLPKLQNTFSKVDLISGTNARRFSRCLGLRKTPGINEDTDQDDMDESPQKNYSKLQRLASSPARACLDSRLPPSTSNTDANAKPKPQYMYFDSMECSLYRDNKGVRLCVKPRQPAETSKSKPQATEFLLFDQYAGIGFVRMRTLNVRGKKASSHASQGASGTGRSSKPGRRYSNSILSVVSLLPNSFPSTDNQDIPELFDFESLLNPDSRDLLMPSESLSDQDPNDPQTNPATSQELSRLDNLFFPHELTRETYSTGYCNVELNSNEDSESTDTKPRPDTTIQRLVITYKRALVLASRLLRNLEAHSKSELVDSSGCTLKIGPTNTLDRLQQIAAKIWSTYRSEHSQPKQESDCNTTLNRLDQIFKELAQLLDLGEQALTAYELSISGLVQALLFCLSAAHAGRWRCPKVSVKMDSTMALLWYLQCRRLLFARHFVSSVGSPNFSCLVKKLVQSFELSEHLPLFLFSSVLYNYDGNSNETTKHPTSSSDSNALLSSNMQKLDEFAKLGGSYAASLPLGLLKSLNTLRPRSSSDQYNLFHIQITSVQPFQDSVDLSELTALTRFCPCLVTNSDSETYKHGFDKVSVGVPLNLNKLTNRPDGSRLKDWTGTNLVVTPLSTVGQLEHFLTKMSTKQWYENPRTSLPYWHQIELANSSPSSGGLVFPAPPPGNSSADYLGGVIDWLATNGYRLPLEDWVNPALIGLVTVAVSACSSSNVRQASILGPQAGAIVGGLTIRGSGIGVITKPKRINSSTSPSQKADGDSDQRSSHTKLNDSDDTQESDDLHNTHAWFAVDLGLQLLPSAYTLAYLRRSDVSRLSLAPRNWRLEASNNATDWVVLREHVEDSSIQSVSGSRATWNLEDGVDKALAKSNITSSPKEGSAALAESNRGWRYFKLQSTGPNAAGNKEFALGGLEFYGTVFKAHNTVLPAGCLAQRIYKTVWSSNFDPNHQNSREWKKKKNTKSKKRPKKDKRDPDHDSPKPATTEDSPTQPEVPVADMATFELLPFAFRSDDDDDNDDDNDRDDEDRENPDSNLPELLMFGKSDPKLTDTPSDEDSPVDLSFIDNVELNQMAQLIKNLNLMGLGSPDKNLLRCLDALLSGDASETSNQCQVPIQTDDSNHRSLSVLSQNTENSTIEPVSSEPQAVTTSNPTFATSSVVADSLCTDLLKFIDQDNGDSPDLSADNSNFPFPTNSDEADALEFAETVEAIIRSNTERDFSDQEFNIANAKPLPSSKIVQSTTEIDKQLSKKRLDDPSSEPESLYESGSGFRTAPTLVTQKSEPSRGVCKRISSPTSVSSARLTLRHRFSNNRSRALGSFSELSTRPAPPNKLSESGASTELFHSSRLRGHLHRRLIRHRPHPTPTSEPQTEDGNTEQHASSSSSTPLLWVEATDALRLPLGLIPVFNPHPGSTNAPTTTAYMLRQPCATTGQYSQIESSTVDPSPRLALFLGAFQNSKLIAQVHMNNKDATLFSYVQELAQRLSSREPEHIVPKPEQPKKPKRSSTTTTEPNDDTNNESESGSETSDQPEQEPQQQQQQSSRSKFTLRLAYRFWDPSDDTSNGDNEYGCLPAIPNIRTPYGRPLLDKADLRLTPSLKNTVDYQHEEITIPSLADEFDASYKEIIPYTTQESIESNLEQSPSTPEDILQLLKLLYQISDIDRSDPIHQTETLVFDIESKNLIQLEDFISGRLTKKLLRQIHDPLASASGVLPHWCLSLGTRLNALFSFESRLQFFSACAFGPARSIIWLQNRSGRKLSALPHETLNRALSVGSTTSNGGRQTRLAVFPSSFLSALTGNTNEANSPGLNPEIFLVGPSDLAYLLNTSNIDNCNTNTDEREANNTSSDRLSLETVLASLGVNSPPDSILRRTSSVDNGDLLNCLLIRSTAAQNSQRPQTDKQRDHHIGRLHKEFVRIPRLPHEILQAVHKTMKPSEDQNKELTFWHWASRLMEDHASRKSELEIQFIGEEGTGLGPTLEFYSLLAAELRRRDGLMWVTDDVPLSEQPRTNRPALPVVSSSITLEKSSTGRLTQPDGLSDSDAEDYLLEADAYVNTPHGLFPAPWPGDIVPDEVLYRFYILGITVGKCLQDNRRIDLPLSPPLLKILSAYGRAAQIQKSSDRSNSVSNQSDISVGPNTIDFSRIVDMEGILNTIPLHQDWSSSYPEFANIKDNLMDANQKIDFKTIISNLEYRNLYRVSATDHDDDATKTNHWLSGLLDFNDFCLIYPERTMFMRQVSQFCQKKYAMELETESCSLSTDKLDALSMEVFGFNVEDLCISMEFLPPSKVFGWFSHKLQDTYAWDSPNTNKSTVDKFDLGPEDESSTYDSHPEPVTVHNLEKYLIRTLDFCLDKGIRRQIDAFKDGFERVLPLDWLALFSGSELGQLISGDSVAHWSREDLLAYTVPVFGFTRQSPTYQMLINVLSNFNTLERRAFLQFTTGCSSLPPGGLKNLHPRLRVVRKELTNSGPHPSVNTCVHYLKLPEYKSEEELRTRLLEATREIGFYLN